VDLTNFSTLLTSGQEVLQAAINLQPRQVDFLRHYQTLSRRFAKELARAALEIAILRLEAADKFPFADKLYLTRPALEQASNYELSAYRARRYQGFSRVADLGCSVGGDTLALAAVLPVTGVDRDLLRLHMAQANLTVCDLSEKVNFIQADLTASFPFYNPKSTIHNTQSPYLSLFFDPARRTEERRVFSVKGYQPPLSVIKSWLDRFPALGVKISPGVKLVELAEYDAEVEFISLRGELKDAVLWFGPLKTAYRRATVFSGGVAPGPYVLAAEEQASPPETLPLSKPQAYLYEPDPAILRAGLVAALGVQLEAAQLDPDIAYLTASTLKPTPFARAWVVADWFPFQLKHLRAYLRERNVGQVVVKKRGSPIEPEALIRDLKLKGDEQRVVFLTHLRGRPIVVVCIP